MVGTVAGVAVVASSAVEGRGTVVVAEVEWNVADAAPAVAASEVEGGETVACGAVGPCGACGDCWAVGPCWAAGAGGAVDGSEGKSIFLRSL